MNYIKRLLFTLLIFSTGHVLSQDIGAVSISIPTSTGCNIGSQQIQADIFNYDAATLNGSFDVVYQLNNDAPVTQTDVNILGFGAGQTRTITFLTNLNLTGNYGTHTLRVYTDLGGDVDRNNDTTSITIINYEPTNGGVLTASDTVCQTANYDTLILDNEIGDVVEWQFDNGSGWMPLAVTDTFYIYSNLTVTTKYRVRVQNGTCTEAFSNEITIQVDTAANAGTLSTSKTICLGDPGDTLRLSGYYGNITKWQFDNGSGWMDIANTTDTLTYGSLTTTTSYRTILDTGVCNPDTSNIATITVVPASVGGNIIMNDTVCVTANYDTLVLENSIGTVQRWEYSDDGFSWTPFITNDTFLIYNNLTQTRMYRAYVQSASCPAVYSDTAVIKVEAAAIAGTLSSDETICLGNTGDTLRLSGYLGNITKWQFNNGGGWTDIANTTDTLTYGVLTTTTSYRTIVDTGVCNPDTSNTVTITIVNATVAGNLLANDTVCVNNNRDTLILTNSVGNIVQWESSDDGGFTWVPIINTDTFQIYNNLPNERMYRVLVQASGCSALYSDTVTIKTLPTPVGGTIDDDKSICSGVNTDTLFLLGYTGDVVKWQFNNGGGWTDIANTTDTLVVNNLIVTTSYRAIIGNGGICPNDTSAIATLTVIATTVGGNIIQSDSVCMGANFDTLTLVGHVGDIRWWERSTDNGITWSPIANIDTFQLYSNLTQTTWYRVLVEGTSCPNDYSDTAIITVYTPSLTITPQDTTTFCMGDSVVLDATLGYTTYAWNNGDTNSFTVAKTTGSYKVTITDFRGCTNSDSVDVTVNPLPVADAGDDVTISLGSSTVLNGNGGDTYLWSPGVSLSDVNDQNPVASPDTTTEYTLLVTDANGCQDYDSVIVTVNKDFAFAPKNVITPNGDGFNDTWKVDNLDAYPECIVIIMNRYGAVIYETKGYNNTWDGKSNGEVVSDGTYYYIITCVGTEQVLKGHITVLSK